MVFFFVRPSSFRSSCQMRQCSKKLFDQAFNHDKPVTPIKIDAVGSVSKAFKAFLISSKKDKVQVKQVDVQHRRQTKD